MYFEGRAIKPYAEPVVPAALESGQVYFLVTFVDEEMLLPEMLPLVFIGIGLGDKKTGGYFFQDADSYRAGVRFDSGEEADQANFFCCEEAELNSMFKFENALEVLMGCSLRRRKAAEG